MKKSKIRFLIPLSFMVIFLIVFLIDLFPIELSENDQRSFLEMMCLWETVFFILSNIISVVLIRIFHIQCKNVYKKTLITGVLLLLGVMAMATVMSIFGRGLVSVSVAVVYPIICVFVIAKKVYLTFEEHGKSDIDNPKLSHILAITFINPLLPFLPFLMLFFYAIATMKGLGIK